MFIYKETYVLTAGCFPFLYSEYLMYICHYSSSMEDLENRLYGLSCSLGVRYHLQM